MFIQFPTGEHLGGFQVLTIMKQLLGTFLDESLGHMYSFLLGMTLLGRKGGTYLTLLETTQ